MTQLEDENLSHEDLKRKMVEFLSEVEYSELITVKDGIAHTRPMVYANDGLIIYMVSRKDVTKVEHIKANPNVSVLIIKSFQSPEHIKEVTLEGKACMVSESSERDKAFKLFESKPKVFQFWTGKNSLSVYEVIRIEPSIIKYFDYSKGDQPPCVLEL